jgi:pilus assembly protein CpaC
VLGILFGSHTNNELETQNAMFIIPSVVEAMPSSSLQMVNKALGEYGHFSGNMSKVAPHDFSPPSAR